MTTEITIDEYRKLKKTPRQPNKHVQFNGYTFDSIAECERYKLLLLLVKAGEIHALRVHPLYELQPAFTDYRGCHVRAVAYEGDFEYRERGRLVCEDVKGMRTDVFKLKERLFRYRYPDIELRIVEV